MAGKSNKAAQPDDVLRSVFMAGLLEMQRAGIEVRVGNTGTSLVVGVEAWRYCPSCGSVVTAAEFDQAAQMCRTCASTGTLPQAPDVPETTP